MLRRITDSLWLKVTKK